MNEKYLAKKLDEIEHEVALAVGVANMIGVMWGVCNDQVIKSRDEATANIHKIVKHILSYSPSPKKPKNNKKKGK